MPIERLPDKASDHGLDVAFWSRSCPSGMADAGGLEVAGRLPVQGHAHPVANGLYHERVPPAS